MMVTPLVQRVMRPEDNVNISRLPLIACYHPCLPAPLEARGELLGWISMQTYESAGFLLSALF